ncbi:MAG: TolC family protein [Verrucomicrobiota bacterium]|nr:TolC family protein [Verrucomicrobiota bacterium]
MKSLIKIIMTGAGLISAVSLYAGENTITWAEAVMEAAKRNPDLVASYAGVRGSRAGYYGTYSDFLPQVSVGSGFNRSGTESQGFTTISESYSGNLSARQTLFDGFRNVANVQTGKAQYQVSQANLQGVKSQVSFDLKRAFADLLFSQELVVLNEAIAERRRENARLVDFVFEGGRENRGNKLLSTASFHEAELGVSQSRRDRQVAQKELLRVLGRGGDGDIRVTGNFMPTPPKTKPDFFKIAEATPRLDVAEGQLDVAKAGVTRAQSQFFPQVAMTGSLLQSGNGFYPEDSGWAMGVSVSFPFFPGGKSLFDFQQAKAEFDSSQARLRGVSLQVGVDLERAYQDFLNSMERLAIDDELLEAIEVRAQIARSQYESGLISFQNWDDIENLLIIRRRQRLDSVRRSIIAEASWERAQGKGWIF